MAPKTDRTHGVDHMKPSKWEAATTTKMKVGQSYSSKEKTIVLNVLKYFRRTQPDKSISEIVRCTSQATGCSEKSIFLFRKQQQHEGDEEQQTVTETSSAAVAGVPVAAPIFPSTSLQCYRQQQQPRRRNTSQNSRALKYNDEIRTKIRSIVCHLRTTAKEDVPVSVRMVRNRILADPDMPEFSPMTLRRLLGDMGFYHSKVGKKMVLVEGSKESYLDSSTRNDDAQINVDLMASSTDDEQFLESSDSLFETADSFGASREHNINRFIDIYESIVSSL